MGFTKADLIRLPVLIVFDALLASRVGRIWNYGQVLGFLFTITGAALSLMIFSCHHDIILDIYRLIFGAILHCAVHVWNFYVILIAHQSYYGKSDTAESIIHSALSHIWSESELPIAEIDFITKAFISVVSLQVLHILTLLLLKESMSAFRMLVTMLPALLLAFKTSRTFMIWVIVLSNLPMLLLLCRNVQNIRHRLALVRELRRDDVDAPRGLDYIIYWINATWVTCKVPSVLRLYFVFKCVWGLILLNTEHDLLTNHGHETTRKGGLYYVFTPSASPPNVEYTEWDTMGSYIKNDTTRNLTIYEGLAAVLTDSLTSSFAVGSAISVVGYYAGVGVHNFVGGNDIMQGETLGTMSAVLFCLLAIQTGLSGLPPLKRIGRLYRNSFLLVSAVLHFFLDVVHPVLMTISPQSHIPLRKHFCPLLICVILLVLPSCLCYWLVTTKPVSTWMVALVAFNFELVVKVLSTILVYALYVVDGRSQTTGIVNLDEYVFWIRSISHVIEFVCGLIMFVNGAYILFFESSNLLRAIMMSMHAYVNIYRTLREGLKTLNNRRTVNRRIASLETVDVSAIEEADRDVCSICYQEFGAGNGEVRITRCRHMFHSSCLRKWIFIQDSCPMCDRALFPVEEKKSD